MKYDGTIIGLVSFIQRIFQVWFKNAIKIKISPIPIITFLKEISKILEKSSGVITLKLQIPLNIAARSIRAVGSSEMLVWQVKVNLSNIAVAAAIHCHLVPTALQYDQLDAKIISNLQMKLILRYILQKLSLVSNFLLLGWGAGNGQILPILSAMEPPRGCQLCWGFA